jgi:hypothetical protein
MFLLFNGGVTYRFGQWRAVRSGGSRTTPMRIIGSNADHCRVRNDPHCCQCGRLTSRRSVMAVRRCNNPETIRHTLLMASYGCSTFVYGILQPSV